MIIFNGFMDGMCKIASHHPNFFGSLCVPGSFNFTPSTLLTAYEGKCYRPVASKLNVTEEVFRCLIIDVTEQRQKLIKYPLKIS
jgi:hypothetical protein